MNRLIASKLTTALNDDGLPESSAWEKAQPAIFLDDWQGKSPDPERETQACMLWSPKYFYIRFLCRYREIYVYEGVHSRRDELWLRDVAEAFIRPPGNDLRHYTEFEISPNGDWLDLSIAPGKKSILYCDLKSRVIADPTSRIWTAVIAIPIDCIVERFSPHEVWSINLFRIEGREPNRFYSAWQPTHTPQPNFHVPEAFGKLHFDLS